MKKMRWVLGLVIATVSASGCVMSADLLESDEAWLVADAGAGLDGLGFEEAELGFEAGDPDGIEAMDRASSARIRFPPIIRKPGGGTGTDGPTCGGQCTSDSGCGVGCHCHRNIGLCAADGT